MRAPTLSADVSAALQAALVQELGKHGVTLKADPVRVAPLTSSAALEALRAKAAVVGSYDPKALLPDDVSTEEQATLLNVLAKDSTEDVIQGRVLWRLLPAVRRDALQRLASTDALDPTVAGTPPEHGDRFGTMLQQLLVGKPHSLTSISTEELTDLSSAVEFAAAVRPTMLRPERVRSEMARRAFAESLTAVLPHRVVGRTKEVNRIVKFVRDERTFSGEISPLVITGVGGSGKSTVLAAAIRRLKRGQPVPVVLLDFDRPMLGPDGTTELTLEFIRQLGLAIPDLEQPLAGLQRQVEQESASLEQSENSASQAEWRGSSLDRLLLSELRQRLAKHEVQRRPIALILDTFEEVAIQGSGAVKRVLDWIGSLREEAGLTRLRPIVSGRAVEGLVREGPNHIEKKDYAGETLAIGDLGVADAATLLTILEVPAAAALPLARFYGGNPLVLRLLGDFLRQHPEVDAASLTAGPKGRRAADSEVRMGMLYGRILTHVRDEDVRKLANPGLALRRVTPDLIRKVLAGPCGLGEVGDAQALFERLASQVWLVERRGDAVYHRRDLRRLMLPLLAADDQEKVAQIHRAAAAYYEQSQDPSLDRTLQQVEGVYHALLAGKRQRVPSDLLLPFAEQLGLDVEHLPLAARAQVKLTLGRPLSPEEIGVLPMGQRLDRVTEELRKLMQVPLPEMARDYLQALPASVAQQLDPALRVAVYAGVGNFRAVRGVTAELVSYLSDPKDLRALGASGDASDHPLWIVAVLLGHSRTAVAWHVRSGLQLLATRPRPQLTTVPLLAALVSLLTRTGIAVDADYGALRKGMADLPISRPLGVLALRHAALGAEAGPFAAPVCLGGMTLLDPETIGRLRAILLDDTVVRSFQLTGTTKAGLLTVLEWLEKLRGQKRPSLRRIDSVFRGLSKAGLLLKDDDGRFTGHTKLLRGLTGEFRTAAITLLISAFPTEKDKFRLASAAWQKSRIRPVELQPDRLAKAAQRDPRRWFAPLVDLFDRADRFQEFVELASKLVPKDRGLKDLFKEVRKFERLIRPPASKYKGRRMS